MSDAAAGRAVRAPVDWLVVAGLSFGVCVSNGFARFAYGLILPAMRADLGWSYATAGWVNTSNAVGYLTGAALTFFLLHRADPSRLFAWGMGGTAASLFLSGFTASLEALTILRISAGVFGAFVFISGGALTTRLFSDDPTRNAFAIALYFGGGGVGMILSGVTLPALFDARGAGAWPLAWIGLGVASAACSVLSVWAAGRVVTRNPEARSTSAPIEPVPDRLPIRAMLPQLIGYSLFATGYIVYVTFLVALMETLDASATLVSAVWGLIGLGIVVSPLLWRLVLARFAGGGPLALSTATTALGTAAAVLIPSVGGLLFSAALFGLAVFIAPASVTAFSRKNVPPSLVPSAVALFTLVFAAGQVVGPIAAGVIGDAAGSIEHGILAAAGILASGAGVAAMQRPLS